MRSGGRVVEGARLESEYGSKAHRGFESLPLRHFVRSSHAPVVALDFKPRTIDPDCLIPKRNRHDARPGLKISEDVIPVTIELWGGHECTVNRVGDTYRDQTRLTGHHDRLDDLDRFARLGLKRLRYPVLWERTVGDAPGVYDWSWSDQRMARLRELGIDPIVGLLHHGSGPAFTSLLADDFAAMFADYAAAAAERYPWVTYWVPINEPLTTARFSAPLWPLVSPSPGRSLVLARSPQPDRRYQVGDASHPHRQSRCAPCPDRRSGTRLCDPRGTRYRGLLQRATLGWLGRPVRTGQAGTPLMANFASTRLRETAERDRFSPMSARHHRPQSLCHQ